jgi:O-antigen/teichoic acid export membrane protein
VNPRRFALPDRASDRGLAQGVRALVGREALGIGLSILAVPIIFRLVGPTAFGIYAAALAVTAYLLRLATIGLDYYLSRYPGDVPDSLAQRLLAVVAISGGLLTAGVLAFAPLLAEGIGLPRASAALRVLALYIFITAIARVPIALLENRLEFGRIARIELAALAGYYGLTLPAILLGAGYWGLAAGSLLQGIVTAVFAFASAPIRLALPVIDREVRSALRFAVGAQTSIWTWSLRDLVAPVVIGHLLGAREVGIVAAATLLVSRIAFLRTVVWRASVPALAKMAHDPPKLRSALVRGTAFQAVILGGTLLAFSVVAPWLVPFVLGAPWHEASALIALISIGVLANAIYTLHSSALLGQGQIRTMTSFHLLHVATLAAAALVLVPHWGLLGYGAAEICALWTYVVPHVALRRRIGESISGSTAVIACVIVAALIAPAVLPAPLGALMALAIGLILITGSRAVRRVIADTVTLTLIRTRSYPNPADTGAAA